MSHIKPKINQWLLRNIVGSCPSSNVSITKALYHIWTIFYTFKTEFIIQIGKKQRDKEKPSPAEHPERWTVRQDKGEDKEQRAPVSEVTISMEHADPEMSVGLPNPSLQ